MGEKDGRRHSWPRSRRGRLAYDPVTGLGVCWVCDSLMNAVITDAGYVSHPTCDPYERSPQWPPGDRIISRA